MPALKKGLSGLEPYEGKLSHTVLRGGSGGNITLLPGAQALNSRINPTTSTPKMAPGRYDPVYEEGSQDYSLPYILAWMLPKPQHGGIPQVAGR